MNDDSLTLEAMQAELKAIIAADTLRMHNIFGSRAVAGLEQTLVEDMPVYRNLQVLFDYVVHARIASDYPLQDVLHDLTDYFLELVPSSPMINLYAQPPITGVCHWIVDNAVARWGLDSGEQGTFTIKELAVLAHMDERAVRNTTNPKLTHPLKTFRDTDGTTKIERAEVIAWLERRRTYKRTVYIDTAGQRDLGKDGFTDLTDLWNFVADQAQRLDQDVQALLASSGLIDDYQNWRTQSVGNGWVFNVEGFKTLGSLLGLDVKAFVLAACKPYLAKQLACVEQILASEEEEK